jgi:hypothetical protein
MLTQIVALRMWKWLAAFPSRSARRRTASRSTAGRTWSRLGDRRSNEAARGLFLCLYPAFERGSRLQRIGAEAFVGVAFEVRIFASCRSLRWLEFEGESRLQRIESSGFLFSEFTSLHFRFCIKHQQTSDRKTPASVSIFQTACIDSRECHREYLRVVKQSRCVLPRTGGQFLEPLSNESLVPWTTAVWTSLGESQFGLNGVQHQNFLGNNRPLAAGFHGQETSDNSKSPFVDRFPLSVLTLQASTPDIPHVRLLRSRDAMAKLHFFSGLMASARGLVTE